MTQILLLPLMVYAACGLVLSLAVHLLSLAGVQAGGNTLFVALHVGIFPLWFVVVLVAMKLTGGMKMASKKDHWRAVLSGCPAWMRYTTNGFFIYALVNFAIFIFLAPTGKHVGGNPPSPVWRGFSGHWMAFYSAGLAILTTAYRRGLANLQQRCPNGHSVGVGEEFCSTCGVPIDAQQGWSVPGRK